MSLKTQLEASLERPPEKPSWESERQEFLKSEGEVEAFAKTHGVTEQEARLGVKAHHEAARLFPSQTHGLEEKELRAASTLDQLEGEKARLAGLASEWNSMVDARLVLLRNLQYVAERRQGLERSVNEDLTEALDNALLSHEVPLDAIGLFFGRHAGEKAALIRCAELFARLEKKLAEAESRMREFGEVNGIDPKLWP